MMYYDILSFKEIIMPGEYYSAFKDRVLSTAQERGARQPEWEDVLLVSANDPETRAILTDQGISAGGLRRDILYSLRFGRPEARGFAAYSPGFRDLHTQVIEQLSRDVLTFAASQRLLSKKLGNPQAADMVLGFLGEYLHDREKMVSDPNALELARLRARILNETLTTFAQQFTSDFLPSSLPPMDEGGKQAAMQFSRQVAVKVLETFGSFAMQKGAVMVTDDQPLLVLEVKERDEAADNKQITPYQIVDTTQQAIDPFLRYLLHRNGLVAPDDYEALYQMPDPLVIELGLEAFNYAQTIRERLVKPSHLLPSLLHDSTVLQVIMELDEEGRISEKEDPEELMSFFGTRRGRNFIKFHAAVGEALAPQKGGERFRYHVKATSELRQFLTTADMIVDNKDGSLVQARILEALFGTDATVKEVLLSAGLTEEQLQKWPQAVEKLTEKREARKKKTEPGEEQKKEEEFKINDRQLKDLLDEYSIDLTKLALEGKVDPVIGRSSELYQMMRILLQRGRSNPVLLGEPGVGKTALFDGLAQMIASGRAPKSLIGATILKLDLSAMNSGAMFRGQFEARLLPIIQGVAERNARGDKPPIILCIDELHTAFMAGSASGTPGAGELLKPYLTKGELSIIGATTQRDYAKYIAIDTALDRRFQSIFIGEPGYEDTLEIVKGLKEQYSQHHQIGIDDSLLALIVQLSSRYLPNQQQPDKSIRILDAALARAKMKELEAVDIAHVIETIAAEAKIDPKFLMEGDEERFLRLREDLPKQVLGQPHATSQIAASLITAKADLQDPRKPLGVFMLFGPTGVGKTETARALSRLLHGSEENLIRIDMSDFMEKHEASKLFGAPPGYVGYGEEGFLTGAVRRQPYSVVVLDEIEKANPEVLKQFLQIFEEGEKVDAKGQRVSFRNTIILMTSNLGAQSAIGEAEGEGIDPHSQPEEWVKVTEPIYEMAAKTVFPPEFLNRVDSTIVYQPLSKDVISQLVQTEIGTLSERIRQKYGLTLRITPEIQDLLAEEGYKPEYGARELKRVINRKLTQPLAGWILAQRATIGSTGVIEVTGLNSDFSAGVINI